MGHCCRLEDNVEQRDHDIDQKMICPTLRSRSLNGSGVSVGTHHFTINTVMVSASNVV